MRIFTFYVTAILLFTGTLYCAADVHLDYKLSSKITDEKCSNATGLVFKTSHLQLRGFSKILKTYGEVLEFQDKKWSAAIQLFNDSSPVYLSAGMNYYGASFSKLTSPAPSLVCWPLTQNFSSSIGLSQRGISLSDSVKPLSLYASLNLKKLKTPLKFQSSFFEDNSFIFSTTIAIPFSKHHSLSSSITAYRSYLENTSSTLKKQNAQFKSQWAYSSILQTHYNSPSFKLNFQTAFYENPYKQYGCPQYNMWFRANPVFYGETYLLNVAYFAIPFAKDEPQASPLVSSSSSICRTVEQFDFNPQKIFVLSDGTSFIHLGFYLADSWKVTSSKKPVTLNTAKIRADAKYETDALNTTIDFTMANHLLSGTPPDKSSTPEKYYSTSLNTSIKRDAFRLDTKLNGKYYPPLTASSSSKETLSLGFALNTKQIKSLTLKGDVLFTKKNNQQTTQSTVTLTHKLATKFLSTYIKIEFVIDKK